MLFCTNVSLLIGAARDDRKKGRHRLVPTHRCPRGTSATPCPIQPHHLRLLIQVHLNHFLQDAPASTINPNHNHSILTALHIHIHSSRASNTLPSTQMLEFRYVPCNKCAIVGCGFYVYILLQQPGRPSIHRTVCLLFKPKSKHLFSLI